MFVSRLGEETSGATALNPLRVLIVDESIVVRRVMGRILAQAGYVVAGTLAEPEGVEPFIAAQAVDLVVMGHFDGGRAAALLARARAPGAPRFIVFAAHEQLGDMGRDDALRMGASDVIAKPSTGHLGREFTESFVGRLRDLEVGVRTSHDPIDGPRHAHALRPLGRNVTAIAIGGSTGGVGAIGAIVGALPRQNRVPVFITQHLPANFQPLFVQQLSRLGANPVVQAQDDMIVRPGVIHLAPGNAHLGLVRDAASHVRVRLTTERCHHASFPAVDPMLLSVAAVYRAGACGIILSGMGKDGLAGAAGIVSAGGWMIAQDETSSAVWGMPGAVARSELASAILAPDQIVPLLLRQGLCA